MTFEDICLDDELLEALEVLFDAGVTPEQYRQVYENWGRIND